MASVTFFSRAPCLPRAPGSSPPCPASIATINDSLKLGRAVLTELGDVNPLHKERVEQAGFAVLKAPDIPSILVETAFISNPDEERRLEDSAYQDKIATAIFSAYGHLGSPASVTAGYRPALAVAALLSLAGAAVALAIRQRPARESRPGPQFPGSRPLSVPEARQAAAGTGRGLP